MTPFGGCNTYLSGLYSIHNLIEREHLYHFNNEGDAVMPNDFDGKKLNLWTSATYRIQVQGEVSDSLHHSFSESRITSFQTEEQSTVTTLVVRMRDQAELAGLLNSLYELHLPIISVQILSEDNEPRPTKSN